MNRYEDSLDYRDGYDTGRYHGRDEVFDRLVAQLEEVRDRSLFVDKPGLATALAVVRNTREMYKIGI